MNMRFLFLLVSCLCITSIARSQTIESKAVTALESYFQEDRLALHIHTNKSVFFTGEEIWFTVYGFSRQEDLIASSNHNLKVGLFSEENEELAIRSSCLLNPYTVNQI